MIDFNASHSVTIDARAFTWSGDEGTARGVDLPAHSFGNMRILSSKTGKSMLFSRSRFSVKDGELIISYVAKEPFNFNGRIHFRSFTVHVAHARHELSDTAWSEMSRMLKDITNTASMSAAHAEGSWDDEQRNIVFPLQRDVKTLQSWLT